MALAFGGLGAAHVWAAPRAQNGSSAQRLVRLEPSRWQHYMKPIATHNSGRIY